MRLARCLEPEALDTVQEVIEAGEFIVVPHGVEHFPMALESVCEELLIDQATTATRLASPMAAAR